MAYPELQKRKMERARHRQWRHEAVRAMQRHAQPMGSMLTEQGARPACPACPLLAVSEPVPVLHRELGAPSAALEWWEASSIFNKA